MGVFRRLVLSLGAVALVPLAQVASTVGAPPVHAISSSVPFVVDPAVNNTVANFATTNTTNANEPSIAINPANPQQAVITSFFNNWSSNTSNAPLWYTNNGGQTWTKEFTVPPPTGRPLGCPCDQTIDYDRNGTLFGTYLITDATKGLDVATGSTSDPTQATSWSWNGNPAQLTNTTTQIADQPWLIVNRDATTQTQDDAFVGYDEFGGSNNERVGVSYGVAPPNFTTDQSPGSRLPGDGANAGLRLAKDSSDGRMYALWQTVTAGPNGAGNSPRNVTLHLNRTTDSGANWTLNGNAGGTTIAVGNQDEYDFSFGGVNTLQGGVDHVAVDPATGDVYVVYGQDTDGATTTNNNSIFVDRLVYTGGNLGVAPGYPVQIGTSTDAALPSVAVTSDGTVGVLYDTFDGNNSSGIPTFSAHLFRSTDKGLTWADANLKSFADTAAGTSPPTAGQRDLGDFQQLKSVGNDFYGTFIANRKAFSSTANNVLDPAFFSTATPNADLGITKTGTPNPVTPGGNETYTITVQNHGPFDAVAPRWSDVLPSGTTFVNLGTTAVPPWTCTTPPAGSPGTVSCTTPTLANGASALFTLTVHVNPTVPPGTVLSNTATVTSTTPDLGPSPNSATATATVNCANNVTGSVAGNLTASGGSWCINNASITGSLTVTSGTTALITNSTVNGNLFGTSPAAMSLCNDRVGGQVKITDATGLVVDGDPGDDACAGSTIKGATILTGNAAGVELSHNSIGGNVTFNDNSGVNFFDDQVPEVAGNTIGGSLNCKGNTPSVKNDLDPNSVTGSRTGQCATL